MVRYDEVTVNGRPMQVLVAEAGTGGPHPGILLMEHIGGFDDFTEDYAARLAGEGYSVVSPDVFHVVPPGTEKSKKRSFMTDTQVEQDALAALAHLKTLPNVDASRLGTIGHCMGGRMSMQAALVTDELKVVVDLYGGHMFLSWGDEPKTPFERLDRFSGDFLGLFGAEDKNPSPDDVKKIVARLDELGIDTTVHFFEGAGHAFQNFVEPERYREKQSVEAWNITLAYLKERL
ncbi:MAG: dienelactone hydrolase family protein [Rhodospirillales bacterium]